MSDVAVPIGEPGTGMRLSRISILMVLSFGFTAAVVVMAIFGPLVAPQSPTAQDLQHVFSQPSSGHWLGTDELGRDVLSRLIVGARSALVGPLLIVGGSAVLGNLLGLLAGYRGGRTDAIIMRWVDVMFAIPALLLLIVCAASFGNSYWFTVGLLIVLTTPGETRIVRGAVLEQVPRPYVEAAKTLGVGDWSVMLRHIWPNVSAIVVASGFLSLAGWIVGFAGIAFLGLGGVKPGSPDWGLMIEEARPLLLTNPVAVMAPATMVVIAATSFNLIGDWLYDRISSRGVTR